MPALYIIFAMFFAYSCSSSEDDLPSYSPDDNSRYGVFIDARDSVEYKTVKIGDKTWMLENLKFNANGSVCYPGLEACEDYGRVYDWSMAMGIADSCNVNVCKSLIKPDHRGICPDGWHIPGNAEWESNSDKSFNKIDLGTYWWSADESSDRRGYLAHSLIEGEGVRLYPNEKNFTCSVRCVRD